MAIIAWVIFGYAISIVVCVSIAAVIEFRKESKKVAKFVSTLRAVPNA